MNFKLTVKKGDARLVVEHSPETEHENQIAPFIFREYVQIFSSIPEAKVKISPLILTETEEEI
jgi:hypothetical protein